MIYVTKPKKWIEVTSIDQISAGTRVRMVDGDNGSFEFTVKETSSISVWGHLTYAYAFDVPDRRWFIRNPFWSKPVKPKHIDPGDIKVGDRVQPVDIFVGKRIPFEPFTVHLIQDRELNGEWGTDVVDREWFLIHRPERALPEEPEVGQFFRVDRTGDIYHRGLVDADNEYLFLNRYDGAGYWYKFCEIVSPGDTITLLELTEIEDQS